MDNVEDLECERRRKDEEVDFWKRKFLELQNRFVIQKESEFKITALEDKLDDYKIMHDALHEELQEKSAEFVAVEGKLKESTAARVSAENELNQHKILYDNLKEECTRRFKDLEFQADSRLKYELDMEKKLEGYTKKYDELCVRFREMKEREIFLENELREYKQMCVKLKEQIGTLEEEKKALVEREKKEQERITLLEEEDKKMMKCNEGEKVNQLNEENDKRRAEDDTEVLKSKIRQLETLADYYMNNGTELGKELEDYRMKCNSLTLKLKDKEMKCVRLEDQLRNLMSIKVAIDNEIEGYKTAFTGMKEHIVGLSEDREVSCIREKQLQERITYLEEVVRKTGTGREAETQVLRLDEDNSASKLLVSHGNRERASEPIGLQNKEKNSINERLRSEMDGATVDGHVLPSSDEEKLLGNTDNNFTSVFPPSCNPTSLHGNISEHVSGTYDIVKDEKMNTALASRVELVTLVEKKIGHELKGRSSEKLLIPVQSSVRTLLRGVNEADGSDIGKEISPDHTCNITDKEMHQFLTDAASQRFLLNEDNLTPNKCLKRPLSDMRCEEYESIFEEDETLIPATTKRSRTSEAIISRTKSEDDVPIPVGSTVNFCARGQKMENSISSSRSRSVPPRQCPGQSYCADSTIKHLHKVNVVGKVGSDDSEDKCWHGICVKNSDSSGSGDSSSESEDSKCTDWSFEQVLAEIKRNRLRESKWQFEADMLSSFEEDPELCMKAVCALYRQQISFNKLEKGSSCSNSRGFNEYDALRGIALAEFLMDGNQEGDLNKSLKDLEMFDLKAVADCKRLAANYSRQLFNLYQKKEDPFFAPT